MASTYSTLLRLELQTAGENNDTWGDKANTVFQLLENAVSKRQALTVTTADVTLTTNNGADDQARSLMLACSGALTGNRNVIVPALSKMYLVTNDCTGAFTLTVKTAAGTGIAVTQGGNALLYCDGTNVLQITSNFFNTIELGNASDTTLSRPSAGKLAVEGTEVVLQGGNMEVGHVSDTTLSRASAGQIAVEGLQVFKDGNAALELGHASDTTLTRVSPGVVAVEGNPLFTTANDGAGSGLDSDLLDGQHGSFYQSASNLNAGTVPDARMSGAYTGMDARNITAKTGTTKTLSTSAASGGSNGDIWYKY